VEVFSSGSVTLLGPSSFSISGMLSNRVAFTTQIDKHGDVQGNTIVTPEPGTFGLIGTGAGMITLAGIFRRHAFSWAAGRVGPELFSAGH
jgi:hypothetical protein